MSAQKRHRLGEKRSNDSLNRSKQLIVIPIVLSSNILCFGAAELRRSALWLNFASQKPCQEFDLIELNLPTVQDRAVS